MKDITRFQFKYKGNRKYVHGTDMYSAITDLINSRGKMILDDIDFTIHRIAKRNLSGLFIDPSEEISKHNAVASYIYHESNKKGKVILIENNEEIIDRYEYQEEEIVNLTSINVKEKKITLSENIHFLNIEKIVALNKAIHEAAYNEIIGKWYFVRLKTKEDINMLKTNEITLVIDRNMNYKLTRSVIYFDNVKVGYIFFSLK